MSSFLSDASIRPLRSNFARGQSRTSQGLNSLVEEIARTIIPVLVMGENGTGKEAYGRMIHRLSKYSHLPLRKMI